MRAVLLLVLYAILQSIDHSIRKTVTTAANQGEKTSGEVVVALLLFFVISALIISAISAIAFLSSAQYAVTDRRVVAKFGLIKRSSVDILLTKVSGVKVNQSLFGRLFDYGNVIVESSCGGPPEMSQCN